jgi:hypothetical protein
VRAHQWNKRESRQLFVALLGFINKLSMVYLKDVKLSSKPEAGIADKFSGSDNLLVNFGIWQGWLMALELPFALVAPATWQAAYDLFRWRRAQGKNPVQYSPLSLSRQKWPGAPLEFKADDEKAAGLLLADLDRIDHLRGIDRDAFRQVRKEKAKQKKANEKLARSQSILW